MTIDIAHLRELLAKATPGPWVVCWWSRTIKQLRNMQRHLWEKPFNIAKIPCRQGKYPISHEEYEANIELMVALVNAAPELLDRLADTENCICWGVDCPHQAKALDMVYAREREVDELKAKLAAAEERAATEEQKRHDAWEAYHDEKRRGGKRIAELEAEVALLRLEHAQRDKGRYRCSGCLERRCCCSPCPDPHCPWYDDTKEPT